MKCIYHTAVGWFVAVVDLMRHLDNSYEITRVNTPVKLRRRGIAGELMRQVCEDADYEGVTLMLYINPYGDMTRAELEAWYMRLGFKKYKDPSGAGFVYRRPPCQK